MQDIQLICHLRKLTNTYHWPPLKDTLGSWTARVKHFTLGDACHTLVTVAAATKDCRVCSAVMTRCLPCPPAPLMGAAGAGSSGVSVAMSLWGDGRVRQGVV